MPLRLVDDDLDLSLDIAMSWNSLEALGIQLDAVPEHGHQRAIRVAVITSLASILDDGLQPPTKSQVSYALSIAKALTISLTEEALKYMGTMKQYLYCHAPMFHEHQQRHSMRAQAEQS